MMFSERICVILSKMFSSIVSHPIERTIDEYCEHEFQTAKENKKIESQIKFEHANVLDLGCGLGGQTVYFSSQDTNATIGIDIKKKWIDAAKRYAIKKKADKKVDFVRADGADLPIKKNSFDIIIMYDVIEHLPQANRVLEECKRVLKSNGLLYIQFGPPWLNPYGGHLYAYIHIPWCHLIFSEKTIINVLKKSKSSSPITEINHTITQFQNLSRMTIRRFRKIIDEIDFEEIFYEEKFSHKVSFLRFFPLVKEFFVSNVSCIMKKRDMRTHACMRT
ncbi:MAG: class I SAM-dependent methyltransferase [Candidatus Hodarchaeota archaeon]